MKNQKILIVVALIVVVASVVFLSKRQTTNPDAGRGMTGEPTDVALDFYTAWLSDRKSTSTDPYTSGILNSISLSSALQQKLVAAESAFKESGFDPVFCQTNLPSKIRSKTVSQSTSSAQLILVSKEATSSIQAVVTLAAHDNLWLITDISCGAVEQVPEQGEFSFDQTGFLLKQSVPKPLDPNFWYIVFEQNGEKGHTAPLIFSDQSQCVPLKGAEEPCNPDTFTEATHVHIQGNMTETGLDVRRVEVLE